MPSLVPGIYDFLLKTWMAGTSHDESSVMARKQEARSGTIRVGIGGWLYPPWRGNFYPKGLKQADELGYAARWLTSIEINATHYRLQSPASFRKWAAAAPDGFKFSVKGPRLVTQQKVLAETGNFISRFVGSGIAELGDKLGPLVWQFAPFKQFDKEDFGSVPRPPAARAGRAQARSCRLRRDMRALPHRTSSRSCARRRSASCLTDAEDCRISPISLAKWSMRGCSAATTRSMPPTRRASWMRGATARRIWATGEAPDDLPRVMATHEGKPRDAEPRDVFIYFIHEGKLRAPAAAMALIERLD